jgi:ABC-2 type transport system permease protein
MNASRVRAILRKELRDYRRNNAVVVTMAVLPLIFIVQPLISIFAVSASSAAELAHKAPLLYMLGIPALVPAALAASAVVAERQLGTLEPILTTPITREEFLIAKALAVLIPALAVSYGVFAVSVLSIELFADPAVASAVLRGPLLLAQVIFTPLMATASIWLSIAISTRASDTRAAQQISTLASLPAVLVAALIAFDVIHATLGLAFGLGVALLIFDIRGWRIVAPMLDRERLITGTNS